MKVAVIGAGGQLGSELLKLLPARGFECIPLTRAELDVTDPAMVSERLAEHEPQIVINTAAYHKVDECEDNPEKTLLVNAGGARNVSMACKSIGAAHVFISTDYVFDGRKASPYVETDPPNPLSVYGTGKLAAENMVRITLAEHFIIRSTGLYGIAGSSGKGGNFVETMLRLAREGKTIKVVADQVLTPTYTLDLAETISELIRTEEYGLYHATNTSQCSWHEFAAKIFELAGVDADLHETTSKEFGARAMRPPYSVLDNLHLRAIGLPEMRPWQEALAAYMEERRQREV
jgi:dTDP-4-dehydrorhamnose reductase